jgi:NUMOD3 motif
MQPSLAPPSLHKRKTAGYVRDAEKKVVESLLDKRAIEMAMQDHARPVDDAATHDALDEPKRRSLTDETKRKIAYSMLGQRKSDEMRAKVSKKLKGRVPWNKGKKLSPETRARMSEARFGRTAWNKGRRLTSEHRHAISASSAATSRGMTEETRVRMRMARRRPGDGIVAGGPAPEIEKGFYPLVDTVDIHEYITLRRELRVWSDRWYEQNSKRPSLADVRRTARPKIVRKFEQYVSMRDRIRGLAADVCGSLDPKVIPAVSPRDISFGPRNNNSGVYLGQDTIAGERRHHFGIGVSGAENSDVLSEDNYSSINRSSFVSKNVQIGPRSFPSRGDYSSGFQKRDSLHDAEPEQDVLQYGSSALSTSVGQAEYLPTANDYRAIGKYRLMESIEVSKYVQTRRELANWSNGFKKEHGHTPALSDVKVRASPETYQKFCNYVENRDRISGLVEEVCGTGIDDEAEIQKVADTGRTLVDQLKLRVPRLLHARRLSMRSPPHALRPDAV